ncbi:MULTISPECIES: SDR family oxidoreductase [unclassified Streptomyces]|uniref:SDR family oxidoreductase n=1 Tax=unclassified Streptomyces TaxID=2593676 RepID=UPI00225699B5|nr:MULTISPECIES: NAD(P)H-binding protein [unclassified Streptomyces]MCX5141120.1 NAD(P)H-binding protein [Streptomyces sp. NBC_00338]WRZ65611.1 NAD(P)H-binding protein [Streptomyces sp. NBC_01257]WSU59605.1 NAD(P)H-binding protein [Streptomyces sp. NBC_01104]
MIVVTGATGNVGRPLVEALAAAGRQVTAVSRNAAAGPGAAPAQVRHHRADLASPESLRPALDGAEALFLHDTGAGAHLLNVPAILDAAKAGGVARIVLLSSQGVATRPQSASHGAAGRAMEEAVRQSGADWTILRPGGFASNAYAWAEPVRTHRTVAAPFGDVGLPVVDPADIADVAAIALYEDGHAGATYELTGPALTTPRQRARTLADLLGERVDFVEQTADEARAQMRRFMPDPVIDTTLAILGEPTPAEQRISPVTEQLLARPARTFADWAGRNIAAFR